MTRIRRRECDIALGQRNGTLIEHSGILPPLLKLSDRALAGVGQPLCAALPELAGFGIGSVSFAPCSPGASLENNCASD
jgi:hypothetical protein